MSEYSADQSAEGELAFRFVTELPSLALTATVGERWNRGIERLRNTGDLRRWLTESGLLERPVPVGVADLDNARRLREAIYRTAKNIIADTEPSKTDRRTINTYAGVPPLTPELTAHGVRWTARSHTMPAVLSWLARDAIDLFSGDDRLLLRECASDTCGLLFTDTSRPRSRRWCSSESCGGAARAARYRQRHDR